jgi:type I pantothenate kinase
LTDAYDEVAAEILRRCEDGNLPCVVALTGGVAVGKTTTAERLADRLPSVSVVATDGFLFPNAVLSERGLLERKGFPESYDADALERFLADVKAGRSDLEVPEYSHRVYDVVGTRRPAPADVVIVEGVNAMHRPSRHVDVTIYLDADEAAIEGWYVRRFHELRAAAVDDEESFYFGMSAMHDDAADAIARMVWAGINAPNLREHILPARDRADIVLVKGPDHEVVEIRRQPSAGGQSRSG